MGTRQGNGNAVDTGGTASMFTTSQEHSSHPVPPPYPTNQQFSNHPVPPQYPNNQQYSSHPVTPAYSTNPQHGSYSVTTVYTQNPPATVRQNQRPNYRDKTERMAVPAMPMPAAIVCCVLNFLIPGFGTICAGFSSFCCSRNEDIETKNRWVSCLIGWGIGWAQMFTFILCFIGWFWSCAWGVFFIGMSLEYYHNRRIAADGGYIDRPGRSDDVIVTSQPTPSFVAQPVYPPAYSTLPPSNQKQMGQQQQQQQQQQQPPPTAPPPPYPY